MISWGVPLLRALAACHEVRLAELAFSVWVVGVILVWYQLGASC